MRFGQQVYCWKVAGKTIRIMLPMVGYVEIIVELACEAGGGGGDAIGVESSLVGFASTPGKRN